VVTDATSEGAVSVSRGKLPRYWLAAALLAACLAVLVAAAIVLGGSHESRHAKALARREGGAGATTPRHAGAPTAGGLAAGTTSAPADGRSSSGRVNAAEVADPEEASSFPAPASVHHRAAAKPSTASEQIVAAGAPSDAEVKHELAQMQAIERTARQTQQQRLTPVAGGNSVGGNGRIPIPTNVPAAVQRVVAGANAITNFPYVFGGGHASFVDNAYDCSGSVSYALAAGGLLSAPETSGALESWGAPGPGRYITVYAAAGHTYMYVNGIMYNTAGRSGTYASRWQVNPTDNTGYVARHWPGL
jgi:cell wall-associated NlpC family hydrolase